MFCSRRRLFPAARPSVTAKRGYTWMMGSEAVKDPYSAFKPNRLCERPRAGLGRSGKPGDLDTQ